MQGSGNNKNVVNVHKIQEKEQFPMAKKTPFLPQIACQKGVLLPRLHVFVRKEGRKEGRNFHQGCLFFLCF